MNLIIEPIPQKCLSIIESKQLFPVHRIYCVGRNYADHAIEMGHNPDEEPPFFFLKPADVIVSDGEAFPYPELTDDLQHEVEMVVALGEGGLNIKEEDALSKVLGYGVGIDLTRRDLQNEAKKGGRPWDSGKAFDNSAPCSDLTLASACGHPDSAEILIQVNGETRQKANINQMIWKVPQIIARLSSLFTLMPGDLIYTGTPAGVGPLVAGDKLDASLDGIARLAVSCVQ